MYYMTKNFIVPFLVLALSAAFLDPFMVLMPEGMVYGLLMLLFVVFVAYALLVWRESAHDEREVMHRAMAARIAYIAGSASLVLGIIYQAHYDHHVDPFLIGALVVMTVAKYVGFLYAERCC